MKVINFFGAPGAGKSTSAAGLFYEMKKRWFQTELINEFAKELVWSESAHLLSEQNFVFANQEHRLSRLRNKVAVAISDAPLLLSAYYAPPEYPTSFKQFVFDMFQSYDNYNIFVTRSHEYTQVGRVHSEAESDLVSYNLLQFLRQHHIPVHTIPANDASPKFLLYWLVHQGIVDMPAKAVPFSAEDIPPPGWISPVLF